MTRQRAPRKAAKDLLTQKLFEYERQILIDYVTLYKGNLRAVAEALGISRSTLTTKILQHDLAHIASDLRTENGVRGPRR